MITWMGLAGLALIVALCCLNVRAESSEVGFSVRALLPENQMNPDVAYFYLHMEPNQEQVLQVMVNNRTDEEMVVELQANTAFTNAHGVIDYSQMQGGSKVHGTDFESIVTIAEPRISIPAQHSVVAEFQIQLPEEPFDGEILGGLVFTQVPPEAFENELAGAMEIRNIFNYCIAVRLSQGDRALIAPEFTLEGVQMGQRAGFPSLIVSLRNERQMIVKDMEMDVSVYAQDYTKVLSFETLKMAMAPSSEAPYIISLRDTLPLQAGVYHVVAEVRAVEQTWRFDTALHVN